MKYFRFPLNQLTDSLAACGFLPRERLALTSLKSNLNQYNAVHELLSAAGRNHGEIRVTVLDALSKSPLYFKARSVDLSLCWQEGGQEALND